MRWIPGRGRFGLRVRRGRAAATAGGPQPAPTIMSMAAPTNMLDGPMDPAIAAIVDPIAVDEKQCTLLGGAFAMFVQVFLGIAALCTLVYKRHTERPRRPWIVWAFDASKQAFAGGLQHLGNLFFGVVFATKGGASECSWYLLNFAISVGCGAFLLWGAMKVYTRLVNRYNVTLLKTGEYGNPPNWRPWLAQLLVWGLVASGEKVLTVYLVILPWHTTLGSLAAGFERPLLPYPNLELLLVMVIAPPAPPASSPSPHLAPTLNHTLLLLLLLLLLPVR